MYLLYVAETSRTTAAFEMAILRQVAFVSLMCENDSFGGVRVSSLSLCSDPGIGTAAQELSCTEAEPDEGKHYG